MNIATIKKNDIANGPGVRVSVFVSGCRHACPGCFNREAWDFEFGVPYTTAIETEILEALEPPFVEGLTLLGGEPFEPENREGLAALCRSVRAAYPDKSIWCFSGWTFEELLAMSSAGEPLPLLTAIDVLVDGRFRAAEKNPALLFRGSANQRILNVPASLAAAAPVWQPGRWERTMGSGEMEL